MACLSRPCCTAAAQPAARAAFAVAVELLSTAEAPYAVVACRLIRRIALLRLQANWAAWSKVLRGAAVV
jgi:hypothetical protein